LINANKISVPQHEIDVGGELFDKEPPALKLEYHINENHQEQDKEGRVTEQVNIKIGSGHQEKVPLEVLLT
jgi:hypothetical protein